MVLASIFAALTAVCSWLSIPIPPMAFTLQTFGILLALRVLGGKWGSIAIGLYLLLGAVGLPVFSGFRGGIGAFFDPTGGFLWGFLAGALVFRLLENWGTVPAMAGTQTAIYLCGCYWFSRYAGVTFGIAALTCVFPYIIPDLVKFTLALSVGKRLRKHLPSR